MNASRMNRRQALDRLASITAGAGAWAAAGAAQAQPAWPSQPVKVVVPYQAGGSADIMGRLLARKFSEVLNNPFVVDNRAGANGNVGAAWVATAPPDGYTLMVSTTGPLSLNKLLYKNTPFNPVTDFTPIALLADVPLLIAAHPSLPVTSMRELITYLKAHPGKVSYSTGGTGSMGHLAAEMVQHAAGVSMVHVPYRGSAGALNDLVAGQVGLSFDLVPTYLQQISAGKVRPLAVLSPQRVASLPGVPTVMESGINASATGWYAVVGPKGLPPAIVARLNKITNDYLSSAEGRAQLQTLSVRPIGGTPQALAKFIGEELAKWAPIIEPLAATVMQ
ncbi:MAG: tripartite tricarboxylate transporter substrate binding protein [Pseudomonadota bacterium]